ncbi:hypothetical protein RJ641_034685 [Dillenia turbinata]|uniref:Uncharacterized protein n=1 Tax=Dillenia turbinata TaxID=194707 RepID=A0AAN8ZHI5_9MAGN
MVGLGLGSDLLRNLTQAKKQVIPISMFVAVLCLCLVIGHLLEENRWFNKSVTAILINEKESRDAGQETEGDAVADR